ncbi:BTB/POZ domain-containing protein KCTD21-like [Brienomyrus brachyistius]|uniref:BTB/POZ domain-containing protein KCTD21-like n=1 Tax=Brienomyrus brachyistius TaxID=42636 RepID=UPI0020B2470D|nr:BTB/POZ domain-containing protein KCTD21-like [Brienomyrus brachyistius]
MLNLNNTDSNSLQDPVSLNVGGEVYTTTLDTLTRCRDSMLGAMFTGQIPLLRDRRGNFFIDRDGKVFRYILNYLRSNSLDLPDDFKEMALLKREADFFQIRPLLDEIRHYELGPHGAARRSAVLNADADCQVRILHFNLKRGPENYELRSCAVRVYTANVFCTSCAVIESLCARFSYRAQEKVLAPQPSQGKPNYLRMEWVPRPEELPQDLYEKHRYQELTVTSSSRLPDASASSGIPDTRTFMEEMLKIALAEGFRLDSVFPDPSDILNSRSLRFVRY